MAARGKKQAAAAATNTALKKRAGKKKNTDTPVPSSADYAQLSAEGKAKHLLATKSVGKYDALVKQGKTFLEKFVTARRSSCDELEHGEEVLDNDVLEKAFDNPPNRYSAKALEYFLVDRCIINGCQEGTAAGIHAAFLFYWERMYVSLTGKIAG